MRPDVSIEPVQQPRFQLITRHASAITGDNARLDAHVNVFWGSSHHQSVEMSRFLTLALHHITIHNPRPTITAFTLTQFSSVISSGTVTKRSVNEAEPCRTDPRWDLLTEPGQHGSVRLFGECKHFICPIWKDGKRAYEQRDNEIEHGLFTPLVLSTSGGMGKAATVFYKRLASNW